MLCSALRTCVMKFKASLLGLTCLVAAHASLCAESDTQTHLIPRVALPPPLVHASPCAKPDTQTHQIPRVALAQIASRLTRPTHIAFARDGSGNLFVVEQPGTIRIVDNGVLLLAPFLDLSDQVSSESGHGLLGLAFHPNYRVNHLFYVSYTARERDEPVIVISQFRANSPTAADAYSESIVMKVPSPEGAQAGGHLAFGPDRRLYIGLGGVNAERTGQSGETYLRGALLRVGVDYEVPVVHPPLDRGMRLTLHLGYLVPDDNPVRRRDGRMSEVWARGFREPGQFSFDALTRELLLTDRAGIHAQEINLVIRGGHYGWPLTASASCLQGDDCDQGGSVLCGW